MGDTNTACSYRVFMIINTHNNYCYTCSTAVLIISFIRGFEWAYEGKEPISGTEGGEGGKTGKSKLQRC